MPPSSPLKARTHSQKSTVVRQALVTPFCCFLYLIHKDAQEIAHVLQSKGEKTKNKTKKIPKQNIAFIRQNNKSESAFKKRRHPKFVFAPKKLKCCVISV